jgi:hypothetical protein
MSCGRRRRPAAALPSFKEGSHDNPTFDTRLIIRVETSELAGFRGMYPIRSSLHSLLG